MSSASTTTQNWSIVLAVHSIADIHSDRSFWSFVIFFPLVRFSRPNIPWRSFCPRNFQSKSCSEFDICWRDARAHISAKATTYCIHRIHHVEWFRTKEIEEGLIKLDTLQWRTKLDWPKYALVFIPNGRHTYTSARGGPFFYSSQHDSTWFHSNPLTGSHNSPTLMFPSQFFPLSSCPSSSALSYVPYCHCVYFISMMLTLNSIGDCVRENVWRYATLLLTIYVILTWFYSVFSFINWRWYNYLL